MKAIEVINPERISLKNHPELNEAWLQDIIARNPEILGLGELILKDKERKQPRAGRLDILLQDPEINKRYEVEIQLGKTDESHIIRTIEYWDIERKRYPQYEHCAVIVAEEITSRFLNVISLFNGSIPLIAIQLSVYKHNSSYFLTFNPVLTEINLGLVDEDEELSEITDRSYWEKNKGTESTVKIVDKLLELIQELFPGYELKYNKFYIGLTFNSRTDNFAIFRAKKNFTRMEVRLDKSDELEARFDQSGIDLMDYDKRSGRYRIKITMTDINKHKKFIQDILKLSKGITEESAGDEDNN